MKLTKPRAEKQKSRDSKADIAAVWGTLVPGFAPGEMKLLTHCGRCFQFCLYDWRAGKRGDVVRCACGCIKKQIVLVRDGRGAVE